MVKLGFIISALCQKNILIKIVNVGLPVCVCVHLYACGCALVCVCVCTCMRVCVYGSQEAYSVARQFNLIPPICEQAEYHMFQREKVEVQLPELFHKIGL